MMEATASLLFSLRKRTSGNEEDEAQRENAMVVVVIVRSFFARGCVVVCILPVRARLKK
jgi:hypothetical protein